MKKLESQLSALLIGSTATKMWFPHFRKSKDYDIYTINTDFQDELQERLDERLVIRRQDHRKFFCKIDNRYTFDIARHTDTSYIPEVIEANRSSKIIGLFGTRLLLAKPTTLLMIKDVHSCFRHHWVKHIRDLIFLRAMVQEPYSDAEQRAYEKGMIYFQQFYKDAQNGLREVLLDEINNTGPDFWKLNSLVQCANLESRIRIQKYLVNILETKYEASLF